MSLNDYQSDVLGARMKQIEDGVLECTDRTADVLRMSAAVGEIAEILANNINANYVDLRDKLTVNIGEVWKHLAVIADTVQVPLEFVEQFARNETKTSTSVTYYTLKLASSVGRLNAIWWEKRLNIADENKKSIQQIREEDLNDNSTLRSQVVNECVVIMHVLIKLMIACEVDQDEALGRSLNKL